MGILCWNYLKHKAIFWHFDHSKVYIRRLRAQLTYDFCSHTLNLIEAGQKVILYFPDASAIRSPMSVEWGPSWYPRRIDHANETLPFWRHWTAYSIELFYSRSQMTLVSLIMGLKLMLLECLKGHLGHQQQRHFVSGSLHCVLKI
jgi:hypothetical protein